MKQRTVLTAMALAAAFATPALAQQSPPPAPPAAVPPTPPAPEAPSPIPPPTPSEPTLAQPPSSETQAATPQPAEATQPAAVTDPTPAPEGVKASVALAPKPVAKPVLAPVPLLGLALGAPDTGSLPGRFRPSYGIAPQSVSDYRFDFHGYLQVPLRAGMNQREHASSTQHKSVLHGPPLVPDDYERFEHTGTIPMPWVQLGFSYGNSRAVANIIIAARTVSNGAAYFSPPNQLGINDAYLTFRPDVGHGLDWTIDVGGFANRYGALGDYNSGRYDTSIIGRVGGVGETMRFHVPLTSELSFLAEHGFAGQWDRAPLGVEPAGWNGWSDANVGTSVAHHAHLGLALRERGQFALHYINAFTRDDRNAPDQPDGSITVFGADVNAQLAPFGRLAIAGAYTKADSARSVSPVLRVLNTAGGPGLMSEYLGPQSHGTGTLSTIGAQYDVSIGEVIRGSNRFSGYGPDIVLSGFGIFTHVTSDDRDYDKIDKLKYGGEASYSLTSWLAVSGRYDRVVSRISDGTKTYAVVTPRIILRSDYNSQDQVTIGYSHWFYGSNVVVRNQYAPCITPANLGTTPDIACGDPSIVPDADTFTLTANMWW